MQSHNRFRLIVFVCALVVLAISTTWFHMVMQKSAADAPVVATRTEPDYFIDNFEMFRISTDKEKESQHYLTGLRLIHYPADDSYYIEKPVMKSIDRQSQLLTVRANYSRIEDSNSKIHLHENVTAHRSSATPKQSVQLSSEYVLYLPNDDILWSDQKVLVQREHSTISGIGVHANNATGELEIHSQAKVIYRTPK